MRKTGSFKAKNKLGARLERVEHGFDRKKAIRAVAGLREASKGVTLRGLKIAGLIDEGRP